MSVTGCVCGVKRCRRLECWLRARCITPGDKPCPSALREWCDLSFPWHCTLSWPHTTFRGHLSWLSFLWLSLGWLSLALQQAAAALNEAHGAGGQWLLPRVLTLWWLQLLGTEPPAAPHRCAGAQSCPAQGVYWLTVCPGADEGEYMTSCCGWQSWDCPIGKGDTGRAHPSIHGGSEGTARGRAVGMSPTVWMQRSAFSA